MDENEFLDSNEQDSYLYGTTFSSVREIMSENKLCVIDCRPEVRNFWVIFYHLSALLKTRAKRAMYTLKLN